MYMYEQKEMKETFIHANENDPNQDSSEIDIHKPPSIDVPLCHYFAIIWILEMGL